MGRRVATPWGEVEQSAGPAEQVPTEACMPLRLRVCDTTHAAMREQLLVCLAPTLTLAAVTHMRCTPGPSLLTPNICMNSPMPAALKFCPKLMARVVTWRRARRMGTDANRGPSIRLIAPLCIASCPVPSPQFAVPSRGSHIFRRTRPVVVKASQEKGVTESIVSTDEAPHQNPPILRSLSPAAAANVTDQEALPIYARRHIRRPR